MHVCMHVYILDQRPPYDVTIHSINVRISIVEIKSRDMYVFTCKKGLKTDVLF